MSNKKVQKVIVYTMVIIMLVSTVAMGAALVM
ncbi:MAG: stressosome-associated protein Prli42 [Lysinibacillus sp.]